uniref:Uncharacterized protein n=1 Tax=Rhipicephalus zambeziensis TaxID=60191 RepID=A0A224YH97_9ACAR
MRLVRICEDGSRSTVRLTSLLKILCQTSKARRSNIAARGSIVIMAKAGICPVLHCASRILRKLLRLCSWCSFFRRIQSLRQDDPSSARVREADGSLSPVSNTDSFTVKF